MWTLLTVSSTLIISVIFISINSIVNTTEEESSFSETVTLIARLYEENCKGNLTNGAMQSISSSVEDKKECSFYIFGSDGAVFQISEINARLISFDSTIVDELTPYAEKVFSGNAFKGYDIKINGESVIIAGEPVILDGEIQYAVVGIRPTSESRKQQTALNAVFTATIILVVPVGIVIIIIATGRLIMPLTEVAEVAIDMSHGNLNARVKDENQKGEVGLIARSFNQLSASLSKNFTQLEQERLRLIQIVNSSTHGIAVTDADGELIQYNPALLELFSDMRYESKRTISDNQRLMVIPDEDVWGHFDNVTRTGESERVVYPLDKERVLWITISPVMSTEGEKVGAVGYFQDMTELERLERTRREYVANVSHELRRPLTAVQGLLEPIRDGLVTDEADKQRYYDIMLHEIQRLSRLISDMMQLSRLQSESINMNIEPMDVSDIVIDVAEGYRSDVEGRGTCLSVDAPEGMFALVDGDKVEQVLIILLDNAMRFTPNDGKISISIRRSDKYIVLKVSDTGCGISTADLPHIFERFYKADKSHGSEGTGLGLSIAQHIMYRLDGKISCESVLGKGSTMIVCFKACDENDVGSLGGYR